jgi:WD40 repeat protein
VTSLCWSRQAPSHTPRLFTASADATLIVWDALNGQKLRRLRGHHGIINAVAVSRGPVRGAAELLVSGGDDGNVMLWDWENSGKPRDSFKVGYPVTAVEFSEDGSQVYVGGLDNEIHVSRREQLQRSGGVVGSCWRRGLDVKGSSDVLQATQATFSPVAQQLCKVARTAHLGALACWP